MIELLAFLDSWDSIYNDVSCRSASTQVHEIGHNLNLDHSGDGNDEYEDETGLMGYSISSNSAGDSGDDGEENSRCFNAVKVSFVSNLADAQVVRSWYRLHLELATGMVFG